jgi:hypothetical protein
MGVLSSSSAAPFKYTVLLNNAGLAYPGTRSRQQAPAEPPQGHKVTPATCCPERNEQSRLPLIQAAFEG